MARGDGPDVTGPPQTKRDMRRLCREERCVLGERRAWKPGARLPVAKGMMTEEAADVAACGRRELSVPPDRVYCTSDVPNKTSCRILV